MGCRKRFCRTCVPPFLRSRNWLQVLLLLLGVLLGGAAVLIQLEAPHERLQANQYAAVLRRLDGLVEEGHLNRSEVATLRRFAEQTAAAPQFDTMSDGDGDDDDQYTPNWSPVGAVWFMFTLVSTIGYGNYTPQTLAGRTAVVVLGTVGIPLFGYLVLLVGRELNDVAQHGKLIRALRRRRKRRDSATGLAQGFLVDPFATSPRAKRSSLWPHFVHVSILLGTLAVGTLVTHSLQVFNDDVTIELANKDAPRDAVHGNSHGTVFEALYFSFISATTCGFGDLAPRLDEPWRLASLAVWLVIFVHSQQYAVSTSKCRCTAVSSCCIVLTESCALSTCSSCFFSCHLWRSRLQSSPIQFQV